MADEAVIEGTLERVVFQNPESQWTVARFAVDDADADDAITVVGPLLGVTEGTPLRLRGAWVVDRRYGRQFKLDSYQTITPSTLLGIERYLGSGLIPGIGPELAKRIVATFGMDTLEVIGQTPRRLTEVEGIGPQRVEKIAGAWREQREVQDVMVFLRGHGVSTAYAVRIYKKYGSGAVGLIRENPYRLVEIWGIGFKSADAIARSLGIARDAPERVEAGLVHVLHKLGEDGHVHVPRQELIAQAAALLDIDAGRVPAALEALEEAELVIREVLGGRGQCISLRAMHRAEEDAAAAFAVIARTPMPPMKIELAKVLGRFERERNVELAPQQRRAVEAASVDKIVVVTGGPGVGKTTIVRALCHLFGAAGRRVGLAAPTGRAAMRLSETTGAEALTLHRLLEFQPHEMRFARDPERPLVLDAVIVDEVSMVDIDLFRSLLLAIPPAAQLVLVGDIDQLPSVGPGSVLADVIASDAATVVRLTEIFRQAAESHIVTNAHLVNEGKLPRLDPPPGKDAERTDFYFVARDEPVPARETIVELVASRIPERFGFDPLTEIQVLCPMHRGELGTGTLNRALQERLNPKRLGVPEVPRGERAFRAGDKVMQIRNDYDKSVFNGDIGVIRDVLGDGAKLIVQFHDGRVATYERSELDQLVHAYAVSVHKSQGSEYPCVVLPLATQHYMMLQRNLLYTAITRGKQLVVIVGSTRAVKMAVRNNATRTRWTYLAERIRTFMSVDV